MYVPEKEMSALDDASLAGCAGEMPTVRDPTGDQRTNTEHELLQSGNSATNTRITDLALVRWNNHSQDSSTARWLVLLTE